MNYENPIDTKAATDLLVAASGGLPCGAKVVDLSMAGRDGIVLADLPDNDVTPYVSWRFVAGLPGYFFGHYSPSLIQARADFRDRVRRRDA